MSAKPKNQEVRYHLNFWAMVNNIVLSLISKGQIPYILAFIIILVLTIKLPNEQVYGVLMEIVKLFDDFSNLGWILLAIFILASFFLFKFIRKSVINEVKRITDEKSELHSLLGVPTSSSDK